MHYILEDVIGQIPSSLERYLALDIECFISDWTAQAYNTLHGVDVIVLYNVSLISTIVERVVRSWLTEYLSSNNLQQSSQPSPVWLP